MSFMKRQTARLLEWLADKTGSTVIPNIGAGFVLSEDRNLQLYLPMPETFKENENARAIAIMAAGVSVILRDHEDNLTLYEALVRAGIELGIGENAASRFAGDLINGSKANDGEPSRVQGLANAGSSIRPDEVKA